ncbi:MAG: hypothetical protein PUA56_02880 [Bacillales bacterium]|nr:hypothetical protein [Bacillales bacterium]
MKFKKRPVNVFNFVFMSIWFVFATVLFVVALTVFLKARNSEDADMISTWFICGAICCVPIIAQILKLITDQTKKSFRQGANEYDVTVSDSSVTVKNRALSSAIIGFFAAILASLAIGMFLLPVFLIKEIIFLIKCIVTFVKQSKAKKANNVNVEK